MCFAENGNLLLLWIFYFSILLGAVFMWLRINLWIIKMWALLVMWAAVCRYEPFDFHKECKNMKWYRLSILMDRIAAEEQQIGSVPGLKLFPWWASPLSGCIHIHTITSLGTHVLCM